MNPCCNVIQKRKWHKRFPTSADFDESRSDRTEYEADQARYKACKTPKRVPLKKVLTLQEGGQKRVFEKATGKEDANRKRSVDQEDSESAEVVQPQRTSGVKDAAVGLEKVETRQR